MRQSVRAAGWIWVPGLVLTLSLLAGCSGSKESGSDVSTVTPGGAADGSGDDGQRLPPAEQAIRVVAEVNGSPILGRKVNEVAAVNKARIQSEGGTLSEEAERELRRRALSLIVDAELLAQAAESEGLVVDPQHIEQQIQEIRASFGSEEAYRNYLDGASLTEEGIRAEAQRQLLTRLYIQSLTKGLSVDEAQARRLYEEQKDRFKEAEQVRAAYILVKCAPDDPPARREDARKRIEEVYQLIQGGEDFGRIAQEYSEAPNAARGGDVGFFPRGVMVPQFEEVAFNTPAGEVTPIFETAFGFNILKVLERQEARPKAFEEVKSTLMLLVAQQQESQVLQERLAELREAATIKILDEEFQQLQDEQEQPAAEQG